MFYVIIEHGSTDACLVVDDDGTPVEFSSEADAIERAKEFGEGLVVRAVGCLAAKTTHRYTKIK